MNQQWLVYASISGRLRTARIRIVAETAIALVVNLCRGKGLHPASWDDQTARVASTGWSEAPSELPECDHYDSGGNPTRGVRELCTALRH